MKKTGKYPLIIMINQIDSTVLFQWCYLDADLLHGAPHTLDGNSEICTYRFCEITSFDKNIVVRSGTRTSLCLILKVLVNALKRSFASEVEFFG